MLLDFVKLKLNVNWWCCWWPSNTLDLEGLLNAGADINMANGQGVTPIHKAAVFGQGAIVKTLVDKGADINATDSAGDTPLHLASRGGFAGIVKLCIERKANQIANAAGQTPKDCALTEAIGGLFAPPTE